MRKAKPALRRGDFVAVTPQPRGTLIYRRELAGHPSILVALNFSARTVMLETPGGWTSLLKGAPAQVRDLAARADGRAVVLTWTAPGDDGTVGRAEFFRSVIRSAARLTYNQVQKVLEAQSAEQRADGNEPNPAEALSWGVTRDHARRYFDWPDFRVSPASAATGLSLSAMARAWSTVRSRVSEVIRQKSSANMIT